MAVEKVLPLIGDERAFEYLPVWRSFARSRVCYDTPTGCMIGLGDAGVLFSMDPLTGASPCVRSGGQVSLTPGDFYCDGASGHVQGYGSSASHRPTSTSARPA